MFEGLCEEYLAAYEQRRAAGVGWPGSGVLRTIQSMEGCLRAFILYLRVGLEKLSDEFKRCAHGSVGVTAFARPKLWKGRAYTLDNQVRSIRKLSAQVSTMLAHTTTQ